VTKDHGEPAEDAIYYLEQQELTVDDFGAEGYVLDIGGGGEGIIGKLKGKQVVAIDPNKRELEEAASGPLKIIMDARDLQFPDRTFTVATSFFTLMYIKVPDHAEVFGEVLRVLRPGGRFLIWDVVLPQRLYQSKDFVAFPLLVKLPDEEVSTGYGCPWPEKEQDLAYYAQLAQDAGFEVVTESQENRVVFLELKAEEALESGYQESHPRGLH